LLRSTASRMWFVRPNYVDLGRGDVINPLTVQTTLTSYTTVPMFVGDKKLQTFMAAEIFLQAFTFMLEMRRHSLLCNQE